MAQSLPKWKRKIVVADLANPTISAGEGLISVGLTSPNGENMFRFWYKDLARTQDGLKVTLLEPQDADIYYVYGLAGFPVAESLLLKFKIILN